MNEDAQRMKDESEKFFKNAFCAKKAEQVFSKNLSDFTATGIIKITAGDKRDDFYVALLKEK